jgi:senataxin
LTKIEQCKKELIDLENMNKYTNQENDKKLLKEKLNLFQSEHSKSSGNKTWDFFQAENKLLKEAQIIICTLSTSASEKLLRVDREFDLCIIDESAQTTEISTLIPFRHTINKFIMIGDHKQLPATVFSETNKELGYEISLFERLQHNNVESNML